MSDIDKLIRRLRNSPEASLADLQRVLESHGFEQKRIKGSHHIFRNDENACMITIPTVGGRKVKKIYIQKVLSLLDLD